jgi:DNA-binding CsgD family transcriptional regulator
VITLEEWAEVRRLHRAEGVPIKEIARRLGVAGATVDYHVERLARVAEAGPDAQPAAVAPKTVGTRDRVRVLLAQSLGHNEIARCLGLSRSTVTYHAHRLGAPVDDRGARRYDWAEVQVYYDAGHSVRECQARFGFSRQTWHAAVKRGAVVARPHPLPLQELLVAGVDPGRFNLKLRLLRAGLKTNACESCGLHEWNGQAIALALHHVNGDRYDNRLENLQLLCPNCHSQTPNFGVKNWRQARAKGEAA